MTEYGLFVFLKSARIQAFNQTEDLLLEAVPSFSETDICLSKSIGIAWSFFLQNDLLKAGFTVAKNSYLTCFNAFTLKVAELKLH